MIVGVRLWRLVSLLGGFTHVAASSALVAGRRHRHHRAVLGFAAVSWAVGLWAALSALTAMA